MDRPAFGRFVGRTEDLEALVARLDAGAPLVTLTGAAGIGKTSLATELAAAWAAKTGVRVAVCSLVDGRDEADLRDAVARALSVTASAAPDGADSLGTALAALGPCLLVLDNFEHLVRHAEATVEAWLAATPELQIVVTSRERLGLAGEIVHELRPLEAPAAWQLWTARVEQTLGPYLPSETERADVVQLLDELDGIPLAIELAAARVGTLAPAEILARLRVRLDVLATRDRARRNATLASAIDASWDLLSPVEQRALAQCAVFRGPIAVDAAEAVLDVGADALDVLQALREKSLLVRTAHGKLRMFASIRKYAKQKLDESGDHDATRERHGRYFVDRAETLARGALEAPRAARTGLEDARENILAVVQRGLAAGDATMLERSLRALVAVDEPHWAEGGAALVHLAAFDRALGDPRLDRVAPAVQVRARIARCRIAWLAARFETSEEDIRVALAMARAIAEPELEVLALRFSSLVHLLRGALDASEADARNALVIAERLARPRLVGMVQVMLGYVARVRGDQVGARRHIDQALERFLAVDDRPFVLSVLLESMLVHLDAGELDLAASYAARAAARQAEDGVEPSARYVFGLGHAAMLAGDANAAAGHYETALTVARASGEVAWEVSATVCRAVAWFDLGRASAARAELNEVRLRASRAGPHLYTGMLEALMAVVEATLGHAEEARALLARAAAAASSPAHRFGLELCRLHVELSLAAENDDVAREELRATLRLADLPGSPWVAEARILARVLLRSLSSPAPRGSDRTLRIAADASWVEPPDGARIACGNRPVMRRLLSALASAHDRAPRAPLSADQLVEACWPGERLRRASAKNRLHVLLTRTRSLGFRDLIEGDDRGYAFAADLRVEREA